MPNSPYIQPSSHGLVMPDWRSKVAHRIFDSLHGFHKFLAPGLGFAEFFGRLNEKEDINQDQNKALKSLLKRLPEIYRK